MRNLIAVLLLISSAHAESLVSERFSGLISTKVTSEGDTLSIGGLYSSESGIFVYSNADGSILKFNCSGIFLKKISFDDIGRGPYLGDDFIVRDEEAIFLNTVDGRLEIFSLSDGRHLRSTEYPVDFFSEEPHRADRLVDRIFLVGDQISLGNGKKQFRLNASLSRPSVDGSTIINGENRRLLAWDGIHKAEETQDGKGIETSQIICGKMPRAGSVRGSQYIFVGGKLYGLQLSDTGFSIEEVLP